MTVEEDDRGVITKGGRFTDDILRATCLGVNLCLDERLVESLGLYSEIFDRKRVVATTTPYNTANSDIAVRVNTSMF